MLVTLAHAVRSGRQEQTHTHTRTHAHTSSHVRMRQLHRCEGTQPIRAHISSQRHCVPLRPEHQLHTPTCVTGTVSRPALSTSCTHPHASQAHRQLSPIAPTCVTGVPSSATNRTHLRHRRRIPLRPEHQLDHRAGGLLWPACRIADAQHAAKAGHQALHHDQPQTHLLFCATCGATCRTRLA